MSELYSPETIADALGLGLDYVRRQLLIHVGKNPVECAACGARHPLEKWGARCGCPEGLQLQIDSLRERVGELEQTAARLPLPHVSIPIGPAREMVRAVSEHILDTRPSWERVKDGEVAPNAGLDPLGASLAEREG